MKVSSGKDKAGAWKIKILYDNLMIKLGSYKKMRLVGADSH